MTALIPPASQDRADTVRLLLARARLCCRRDPQTAQSLLDEARAVPGWDAHPDADAQGRAIQSLIHAERSDSDGALAEARFALEQAQAAPSPRAEALAHYALGTALALDGASDEAGEHLHTAWIRAGRSDALR